MEKWCKEEINENGDENMVVLTKSAQKLKDKFIEEGKEEGIEIAIYAINMIKNGSSLDDISIATGLSKDQISQLCGSNL